MVIWQLQGKKGARNLLRPLKWERALVHHALDWARAHGINEVAMTSFDQLSWAAAEGHLDSGRGRMIYGVTARRCGFEKGTGGYCVLRLSDVAG